MREIWTLSCEWKEVVPLKEQKQKQNLKEYGITHFDKKKTYVVISIRCLQNEIRN